jgi:hypothetical protein
METEADDGPPGLSAAPTPVHPVALAGGGLANEVGLLEAVERAPAGFVAEARDRLRW